MGEAGRTNAGDDNTCFREECSEPRYARLLCKYHYHRARQGLDGEAFPVGSGNWGKLKGKTCAEDGCNEPARARGRCVRHYNKLVYSEQRAKGTHYNSDATRDAHMRNRYGIGLAEYNDLLGRQGNRCAVCGVGADTADRPKSWSKDHPFAIDHCHDTHRVRGLLCNGCNLLLRNNRDADTYRRAAEYLEAGSGDTSKGS